MKTAISLPDKLFEAAEKTAEKLGVTRSGLYARALEAFIAAQNEKTIIAELNEVYSIESSSVDNEIRNAQVRTILNENETW